MSGGRASRHKGNHTERAIVRRLQDRGLAGERVPRAAASLAIFPCPRSDATCVAKRSAAGTDSIVSMIGWRGRDFLVICADRKPLLVVVKLELAAEIVMAEERLKGTAL